MRGIRLLHSWQLGIVVIALLTSCAGVSSAPVTTPTPLPGFTIPVRVQSKVTGIDIAQAAVTMQIGQSTVWSSSTDANGLVRFFLSDRHRHRLGILVVEAQGYRRYNQAIDLVNSASPHLILMELLPPALTATPTATTTSSPTATPTALLLLPMPTNTLTMTPTLSSASFKDSLSRVADTDSCQGINRLGSEGAAYSPSDDDSPELEVSYVEDTERGCVARLAYNVEDWSAFWMELNGFDASPYNAVTFWAKGDLVAGIPPEFKVEIKRDDNREVGIFYVAGLTGQWQKFIVPYHRFKKFFDHPLPNRWDNISELVFTFELIPSAKEGVIFLDDVAFEHLPIDVTGYPEPTATHAPEKDDINEPICDYGRFSRNPAGAAYKPIDDTPELVESYVQEPGRDCLVRLHYNLDGPWAAFWIKLRGFNANPYNTLTFLAKGDPAYGIPPEFKVELKRNNNEEISIFYVSGLTSQWQLFAIPFDSFGPFYDEPPLSGYDNLSELVFTFEITRSGKSGVVFLDDVDVEHRQNSSTGTPAATTFLDEVAADTWAYLKSDWATTNHLPWSWPSLSGGDYANTTEIGLHALSWIGAYEMQADWSPTWTEVETKVTAVLDQLEAWQSGTQASQPHGPNAYNNSVFYQWYWINRNPPVVGADNDDHLVPSIDNAFLATSLITIREYAEVHGHTTLAQKTDNILKSMDFSLWYDQSNHLFYWGAPNNPKSGGYADYYSNENRLINFVARAMGQLSAEEYQLSLEALTQNAATYDRDTPATDDDITVDKVAWDGSYFTYTAPALFIRELNTKYGTKTIVPATEAQIAYAQDQGYLAWGLSDSFDTGTGDYLQQGAPPTGLLGSSEAQPGLVAPHASGLALITPLSDEAISNLQILSATYPSLYNPVYGFKDSVMADPTNPNHGTVSTRYSALAQEWLFLSIVNARTGFIWDYFYRDSGVQAAHIGMFGEPQVFLPVIFK